MDFQVVSDSSFSSSCSSGIEEERDDFSTISTIQPYLFEPLKVKEKTVTSQEEEVCQGCNERSKDLLASW